MTARMAPDYACLSRIFSEIKTRVPDFVPESVIDVGSGVGSTTW